MIRAALVCLGSTSPLAAHISEADGSMDVCATECRDGSASAARFPAGDAGLRPAQGEARPDDGPAAGDASDATDIPPPSPELCDTRVASAHATYGRGIADDLIKLIVEKYNRNDYRGIYALASEEFRKNIDEVQFDRFLRRNRNGGDISRGVLVTEEGDVATYRLEMEARDMILILGVKPPDRFRSFGLKNAPVELLARARDVGSDNPLMTPLDRAVDDAARKYFLNPRAVGLSIGVIKDGATHAYHYGEESRGKGTLPTSRTLYEIGSITKTFTSTLLAQAVCEAKVNLNDDIRKHLDGEFPGLEFEGKPIRLRDLANHTSRLPTLPEDVGSQAGANPLTPESNYDAESFYASLRRVRLDGPPGEKVEYSNWGISLLGHLLEDVYREPYGELLSRQITGPLKMAGTTFKPSERERSRAAVGHFENGKVAPYQDAGMFGPAGDILSNLDDMMLYLGAQLSERLASIQLTHRPTANGMGLGWGVRGHDGHREIQHNGSTNGFTAHISGFLDSRNGCVVLSNSKVGLGELITAIQAELKGK